MNCDLDHKRTALMICIGVKQCDFYHKQMNLFARSKEKTNGD